MGMAKWVVPFIPWLILAILGGCSSTPKLPDNAQIPDASPHREPKSRYGNPESYWVRGRLYHTLASADGYRERGIASWYGPNFHGRLTSNREPYDMFGMTAAHRTLPLPTYVQVTNLRTGKQIVVRVNDRGPFHPNRIIDLSYSAAAKLGILGEGTGLVEVAAIDPDHLPPAPPRAPEDSPAPPVVLQAPSSSAPIPSEAPVVAQVPPASTTMSPAAAAPRQPAQARPAEPHLFVQVGAFGSRSNAERLAAGLSPTVSAAVRIQSVARNPTPIYRVQLGPLSSVDKADALTEELRHLGLAHTQMVIE
jgi:rare lipoprotein A